MDEAGIRKEIQAHANCLVRSATRGDANERNRDTAITICNTLDKLRELASTLYAHPDPMKAK